MQRSKGDFKANISEKNKTIKIYYKDKKLYEYNSCWHDCNLRIEEAEREISRLKEGFSLEKISEKMKRIDQGDVKPKYGFVIFIVALTIILEMIDR